MNRNQIVLLLIEDNPGDALLIQTMLAEDKGMACVFEHVNCLLAGMQRILSGGVDVVLLDLDLPDSSGIDTVRRLRNCAPQLPAIVVMSGHGDEDVAVQAVQEGAQDYLVKGLSDRIMLMRSIRYAIERNKSEESLKKARDELELRVQQRTVALRTEIEERKQVEEELQRMQNRLAHVTRLSTMGEMVASIAHEVNQPLYSILNYAKACGNILSQEPVNRDALNQWIDSIVTAALQAGEIIKRLRNFVRKSKLHRLPSEINQVVNESMAIVEFEARRRNMSTQKQLSPANPIALFDSIQIQQVLVNLLRNAYEALEQNVDGIKQLIIRTIQSEEYIEVTVTDNGPGLADIDDPQIFEPFVTSKPEGLGMGLAISKTIVESHGGKIWVTANPGGGAVFHFTLPIAKGEHSDNA